MATVDVPTDMVWGNRLVGERVVRRPVGDVTESQPVDAVDVNRDRTRCTGVGESLGVSMSELASKISWSTLVVDSFWLRLALRGLAVTDMST